MGWPDLLAAVRRRLELARLELARLELVALVSVVSADRVVRGLVDLKALVRRLKK